MPSNILDRAGISSGNLKSFLNRFGAGFEGPPVIREQDYKEGFVIEELEIDLRSGRISDEPKSKVSLIGNQMPYVPFVFGGEHRIEKVYYPGHPEPSTQVLGPVESDITIKGQLKDVRFKREDFFGYSQLIRDEIDRIRFSGALCRFTLGDWQRYGFVQKTNFSVIRKSRIEYEITFTIISFNAPENAKFVRDSKEVPFGTNEELKRLREEAMEALLRKPVIPDPTISEQIDAIVGDVAESISILTGYVDEVFQTVDDIRRSVGRALGLIEFTKNKVKRMQRTIFSFDPFSPNLGQPLTARFTQASYNSSLISFSAATMSLLERYREQFSTLVNDLPQTRHLVSQGDSWQSIAVRYYGNADSWKEIPEFNDLGIGEDVPVGSIIDIPSL